MSCSICFGKVVVPDDINSQFNYCPNGCLFNEIVFYYQYVDTRGFACSVSGLHFINEQALFDYLKKHRYDLKKVEQQYF